MRPLAQQQVTGTWRMSRCAHADNACRVRRLVHGREVYNNKWLAITTQAQLDIARSDANDKICRNEELARKVEVLQQAAERSEVYVSCKACASGTSMHCSPVTSYA